MIEIAYIAHVPDGRRYYEPAYGHLDSVAFCSRAMKHLGITRKLDDVDSSIRINVLTLFINNDRLLIETFLLSQAMDLPEDKMTDQAFKEHMHMAVSILPEKLRIKVWNLGWYIMLNKTNSDIDLSDMYKFCILETKELARNVAARLSMS